MKIGNCGQDSQPSRRVINQQARSVISCGKTPLGCCCIECDGQGNNAFGGKV